MVKLGKMLRSVGVRPGARRWIPGWCNGPIGRRGRTGCRRRSGWRVWLPTPAAAGLGRSTGGYMATSPSVYAAIKLRADALTRPPLRVYRTGESGGRRRAVEASHPAARLLDRVNPWHTRADLWRATETHLCLWGAAFWAIERDEDGQAELWPPASRPHGRHPGPAGRYVRRVRVPRAGIFDNGAGGLHAGRDRVAALLQPAGGAGRSVASGAGAALGGTWATRGCASTGHLLRNSARPDFLLA